MSSILYAISSSSIPAIRLGGAIASGLICLHSLSFLGSSATSPLSWFRLMHNLADIVIFVVFGVSGIVAELFPKDSATYRLLKANFPFVINLIGRGIFYLVLGCLVMGDYGNSERPGVALGTDGKEDDQGASFTSYFTIVSGLYIALMGTVQLYSALKSRSVRSLQTAELSQPIVAFVPSVNLVDRAPQVEVVEESVAHLPTPV